MNCRHARSDLALVVGHDLTDTHRREELRRHVARCPGCRSHYKRLKESLRVLEDADRAPTYDAADSLWPELSSRIQRRSAAGSPSSRFNGWLPFVAVTAASALLVVMMDSRPAPQSPLPVAPVARDVFGPFRPIPHSGVYRDWQTAVSAPAAAPSTEVIEPAARRPETAPAAPGNF